MTDEYEFYIASSSCEPGCSRAHGNICLTNFHEACKFAMNTSAYDVLWYGWKMYIWHYKVVNNDDIILLNSYNMNDYLAGAIDNKGYFQPYDEIKKEQANKMYRRYEKVVYRKPDNPHIANDRKLPKDKEVIVHSLDQLNPYKFLVGHGYQLEDSCDLVDYKLDEETLEEETEIDYCVYDIDAQIQSICFDGIHADYKDKSSCRQENKNILESTHETDN